MIQSTQLSRQVHRHLLDEIVAGRRPSGSALRETDLADELKVSRTPIREALRQLAADGFVEIQPNRSAVVRSFDVEQLRQIYQVREALEGQAAELACGRLTEADVARLDELTAAVEATSADDPRYAPACHQFDIELHRLVAARANNPILAREIERFHDLVQLVRHRVGNQHQALLRAHAEHKQLLAALRQANSMEARRAMVEHIRSSASIVAQCLTADKSSPATVPLAAQRRTARRPVNPVAGLILLFVACLGSAPAAEPAEPADEPIDFAHQVAPLLTERCLACHQGAAARGGLDLSTRQTALAGGDGGPSIVPGNVDESWLLEMLVAADDQRPEMPQEGESLSADEIARLKRWIAAGAPWPEGLVLQRGPKADVSWWAYQPLSEVLPPTTDERSHGAWSIQPIDRFILAKLHESGLTPSPPATRRELIRRATYDLTGLPPTPEDVEQFVADDADDAYERLIDRLLASPAYGQRWGRHWLDVVRFGESTGFERNVIIDNAWPFRDYVIRSLNDDKPFNQFLIEHLAGDVVAPGDPDVEVGTTFLVAGPYDNVGNQDAAQAAQIRQNTLDDMITAVGSTFLGLTINCARCHDHKFDPLTQADYYRIQAALAGVTHGERVLATGAEKLARQQRVEPLELRQRELNQSLKQLEDQIVSRGEAAHRAKPPEYSRPPLDPYLTEDSFPAIDARLVRLVILADSIGPDRADRLRLDEFEVWSADAPERNVALASQGATAEGRHRVAQDAPEAYAAANAIDGRFGTRWHAAGGELLITLPRVERIHRVTFSTDRPRALSARHAYNTFVAEYRIEASTDGTTWTEVATSLDRPPLSPAYQRQRLLNAFATADEQQQRTELRRQLGDVARQLRQIPELPRVWAGTFRQPDAPTRLLPGGDPARASEVVLPGSVQVLEAAAGGFVLPADALEAERRLALARWLVDDRNPLTPRVLANRLWHYHFGVGLVDTPNDFGYLGGRPTHPELLDWLARRLLEQGWRLKPLHREIMLSQTYRQSSAWRDDAGRVDADTRLYWRQRPRRLSGEEVRDTLLAISGRLDPTMGGPGFRLYDYWQDNVATYVPLDRPGPETYRRAVYHQNARAARVDVLTDFDCPDNALSAPKRAATTTPLQALTMMNHPFLFDMATALAERLAADTSAGDVSAQVERGFGLAFGRRPEKAEQQAAERLIARHGLAVFCRALANANELVYLD